MKDEEAIKVDISLVSLRVKKVLFSISDVVYQWAESIKTSLKINALEYKMDQDIARLGENIFKLRKKDMSSIEIDPALTALTGKVIEDKNRIIAIKTQSGRTALKCLRLLKRFTTP